MTEPRKQIEVVAAIIRRGNQIFATQRGYGPWKDWWEFPGGKIEPGESAEAALQREIREELGVEIALGEKLATVEWDYPEFHLRMQCFMANLQKGEPHLMEHESARWLGYKDLHDVGWLPADRGLLPLLASRLLGIPESLARYIEEQVIPQYAAFDKAHQENHAREVISRAMEMAAHYPVDRNVIYAAAACHDLGLVAGREIHHLESGRIIRADTCLREWFNPSQIECIAQAAEDHRASSKQAPHTVEGRIIAEADRLIVPEQIIRRTIQYGLAHYPALPKEGHWERTLEHLHEKYAEGGYLRLWIPESPNAAQLDRLRAIIRDESRLREIFEKMYAEEVA